MFFKRSKHPDYLNLYLKGPAPLNTIVRTFKIWKVNPIEQILLDFSYDSVLDIWKCKKFCHKKSLTSRHREMEEYRVLCEVSKFNFLNLMFKNVNQNQLTLQIELWRSVESISRETSSEAPSEHFENLFTNGKFHDVIITCENNEFKAHKFLLMEMSPVFESLLCLDTKAQSRIDFKSMRSEAVREMLMFLYTGKINNFDVLPNLMMAAENVRLDCFGVNKNSLTFLILV